MKILALSSEFPPFRGGIGTYAAELARAAYDLGAEITVAAPSYGENLTSKDRSDYPFEVIRYEGGPHGAKDTFKKLALTRSLVAARRYDVVHAMDWPFFLPTAIWARHVRRIYTLHGSDVLDIDKGIKRAAIAASRAFTGDVRVVANSRFTQQLFLSHFPQVARDKVGYEHLGVSKAWLDHTGKVARSDLGLPDDKIVLLTVARVTRRKGHLTVLQALERLAPELREQLFYAIVGPYSEGDYRDQVERAIAQSSCQVQRFEGLDNAKVMQMCAASDIFCLPGAHVSNQLVEGFGLVFLEAGSQRLPSVAGNIGGVAEVVDDGINGLVVPTDDPDALAGALAKFIQDPALRRTLGAAARQKAEALTWNRCAAGTYGL